MIFMCSFPMLLVLLATASVCAAQFQPCSNAGSAADDPLATAEVRYFGHKLVYDFGRSSSSGDTSGGADHPVPKSLRLSCVVQLNKLPSSNSDVAFVERFSLDSGEPLPELPLPHANSPALLALEFSSKVPLRDGDGELADNGAYRCNVTLDGGRSWICSQPLNISLSNFTDSSTIIGTTATLSATGSQGSVVKTNTGNVASKLTSTPSRALSPTTTEIPAIPVAHHSTYIHSTMRIHTTSSTNAHASTEAPTLPHSSAAANTTLSMGTEDGGPHRLTVVMPLAIVLSVVSTLAVLMALLFLCVLMRRKRRLLAHGKVNMMTPVVYNFHHMRKHSDSSMPTGPSLAGMVPGTIPVSRLLLQCYHDLQDSNWLLPYEHLTLGEVLGAGAFGVVRKATAKANDHTMTVAVKMLKDVASEEDEKDMVSELKIQQRIGAHPNIVSLLGASVDLNKGQLFIVVEYCSRGDLLNFVRSKRSDSYDCRLINQLVRLAKQVAEGMEYLSSKKCVHRDLAARNVLITEDFCPKIADFGLARRLYDSLYKASGGRVPIKWLAPECTLDRVFTTRSDVWSFGVLLWEIMSLGLAPYPGLSSKMVLSEIQKGYRMQQPRNCPLTIYQLMLLCWQQSPSKRPEFKQLVHGLQGVLDTECDSSVLSRDRPLKKRIKYCNLAYAREDSMSAYSTGSSASMDISTATYDVWTCNCSSSDSGVKIGSDVATEHLCACTACEEDIEDVSPVPLQLPGVTVSTCSLCSDCKRLVRDSENLFDKSRVGERLNMSYLHLLEGGGELECGRPKSCERDIDSGNEMEDSISLCSVCKHDGRISWHPKQMSTSYSEFNISKSDPKGPWKEVIQQKCYSLNSLYPQTAPSEG